jgi:hypothetical protein
MSLQGEHVGIADIVFAGGSGGYHHKYGLFCRTLARFILRSIPGPSAPAFKHSWQLRFPNLFGLPSFSSPVWTS